jgi:alanyl-tRNA synthetase
MQQRTGIEIRELFLRFFESKGHRRVHSSSLVPANDPTLLFTNAGMNQFKDLFLGAEKREYSRATTSQKCVRAGGKHNDLENVGFTRRHHTFFEMLGNFSFGDYFKRDAIQFAWELVTSEEWFGIPKDRLYVTIFEGDPANGVPRDDEAEGYWIEAGVPKERIKEYGLKDNFWQMGETGPCGPCSEIFYDMGIEAAEHPGVDKPFGHDDARYVEIWNLVFMQFDRMEFFEEVHSSEFQLNQPFGKLIPKGFTLVPLPKPSIDTGMGLERVAAVLQGVVSNFETDLFTPLILRAGQLTNFEELHEFEELEETTSSDEFGELSELLDAAALLNQAKLTSLVANASLRIIADHSRAATFLVNDGVVPSNDRRGYVLRRIIRRALIHGRMLGMEQPFLHGMVETIASQMGSAYPEIRENSAIIGKVIHAEELSFKRNYEMGVVEWDSLLLRKKYERLLGQIDQEDPSSSSAFTDAYRTSLRQRDFGALFAAVEKSLGSSRASRFSDDWLSRGMPPVTIKGDEAFKLRDTYGLSLDFMEEMARDQGHNLDIAGFHRAMEEQQSRARASWKGGSQKSASPAFRELPKTAFLGYKQLTANNAEVLAIVKDGAGVPAAAAGDQVDVVLDQTSFYSDSGGQIGDTGVFLSPDGNTTVAEINGSVLPVQGVRAHKALLKQPLAVGDHVNTVVDGQRRDSIRRNHTGTHLLHAALRQVLGTHVKQAGSSVDPTRLRFDFSHFAQVADEELEEIESIVNREVLSNAKVETLEDIPIDVAVNEYHAMALFGEKYGDKVRVVKLSDGFSTELCGGTHTSATGEIGLIKIVSEESVSSGVRRLEAITGFGSLNTFREDFAVAQVAAQVAGTAGGSLSDGLRARLAAQEDEMKKLRRELDEMRMKSAAGALDEALAKAQDVKGVRLVTLRADSLERGQLRTLVDNLKQKLGEGVVVLASAQPEGKVALIAGVTPGLTKRIQAGKLVGAVAKLVGGSGGGKPEIAEAGGKDQSQIDAALLAASGLVGELLG